MTEESTNPPSLTDEAIVALTRREPVHFGHLIDRYEAKLTRYVRRLGVKRREDQEDVLQEIFLKVYKNLNGFDASFSFSSWIYRIAHNEAISWYRKQHVRPEGHLVDDNETILDHIIAKDQSAERLFDQAVSAEALETALRSLDQKYRDPLVLRFFEHKEYDEISDILQIPIGSVGTLIHRGKHRLRELIDASLVSL